MVLGLASAIIASCTSSSREEFQLPFEPVPLQDGGGAPDGDACNHLTCSRDLKSVLRGCEGAQTVVETCAADQGCGDGHCIPACDAAATSKGSLGCEFATLPPDDRKLNSGDCFVAMIANTWDQPVTLTAELGTAPLDISKSVYAATKVGSDTTYTRIDGPIMPRQVGLVFLSEATDSVTASEGTRCPRDVVPAYAQIPTVAGTNVTRAFHLKTSAPVSAYSIWPYGGAPSQVPTATLLLPTSSWGTNYLAVSAASITVDKSYGNPQQSVGVANRTLQIVANQDGTEVRMLPTVDISPLGGVHGAKHGEPTTYSLSRGQVLQINQSTDLTGSPIESNKPVGVFGGSECVNFPVTYPYCDLTQQQIIPVSQWGHDYALVPNRPRIGNENARDLVPWSFVGAADGTVLTYDPARPVGAPETLAAGERAVFITDQLVSVRSQDDAHPFQVSTYMTGSAYGALLGDPDFVNVVPSAQFLDRYVFFADFTFSDTSVTLVRRKTAKGFSPVKLDCAGEVTGWKPLGTTGEYEFVWLALTESHTPHKLDATHTCGYGLNVAESDGPFGITVWGIDLYASYGFPGGTGSRPITSIQIPVR